MAFFRIKGEIMGLCKIAETISLLKYVGTGSSRILKPTVSSIIWIMSARFICLVSLQLMALDNLRKEKLSLLILIRQFAASGLWVR